MRVESGSTHRWFQIPVGIPVHMQLLKAFQKLMRYLLGLPLWQWLFQVVLKIAQCEVFHCNVRTLGVLIPPKRFDKEALVLIKVSETCNRLLGSVRTFTWENFAIASNSRL